MSLGYTGEATMDEPALRDVERWKDKVEVRLDNRQVFFLFFGSAMVACMLFVLGVIVGKRLESRGRAEAPVVEDPLAALDRFGVEAAGTPAPSALTFPRALLGRDGPAKSDHAERIAPKATLTNVAVTPRLQAPAPTTTTSPPKKLAALPHLLSSAPGLSALAGTASTAAAAKPVTAKATVAKATTEKPTTDKATTAVAAAKAPPAPVRSSAAVPALPAKTQTGSTTKLASSTGTARADKSKGAFLLQLSSFQDRGEAEAFARRFAAQNAYVITTEVPGRGTMYRVRVGSYATLKDAAAAKTSFEHDHGVIAYVAGNGPSQ